MKLKLSQKETMLLEDDKNQEEICVKKYKSYAQQVSDPELQQLFNKLSSEEQHHYDILDQMLKGQEPDMSHHKLNQEQQAQSDSWQSSHKQSGDSWQAALKNTSLSSKAQESSLDKILCSDLLSTEKYVSGTYDTGIFEAANPTVRMALQHIQREEQDHGEQLFQYMNSHGMYNVK